MREPCYKCRFEHKPIDTEPCAYCSDEYMNSGDHPSFQWSKKRTHYDEIHAMNAEELAEYLAERSVAPSCTGKCHKDYEVYGEQRTFCHNCWLDWLRQEVSG